MAQEFKVVWTKRGKRFESEPLSLAEAHNKARELMVGSRAVTILREAEGTDHPANKGKYFLFQIWK